MGHPPAFGVRDSLVKMGCTPTEHTVWDSEQAFSCDTMLNTTGEGRRGFGNTASLHTESATGVPPPPFQCLARAFRSCEL